jgi:hypothetical protein
MNVDRLSMTVPGDVGAALRALALARGTTVSSIVASAIDHEIRLAALDEALTAADARFGAVAEKKLVVEAEGELLRNAKQASPRRRRRA